MRKLLREVDNETDWGSEFVVNLLGISVKKANDLLSELNKEGYIESTRVVKRQRKWKKTFKGSTLGLSTAARSVNRTTAERAYSEFMTRVHNVNNDPKFLFKVVKVIVFGSYLSDAAKVNDIDIAVKLAWKEDHPDVLNKDICRVASLSVTNVES